MSGYQFQRGKMTQFSTDQILTIARGVESVRLRRGISVKQLMNELGFSKNTYWGMKNGTRLSENSARTVRAWLSKHRP